MSNSTPMLFQILRDQAAVTVIGLLFAAEQTGAVEHLRRDRLLDLARFQHFEKLAFVQAPIALVSLVGIENIRRRRQVRACT